MSLNQVICFFYEKFLWKVKKSERWLEKKKMERTKGRKEVNAELFIAE